MSEQTPESAERPLVDLPIVREHAPKGITVHADGSSTEVRYGYDVLHAGRIEATYSPAGDAAPTPPTPT